MKIKKKHPLSIIEIMIVISIIAIVGSVMTHNMKGSLTKGRAFKTESASKQAYDILSLELSSGSTIKQIINSPETILVESGLVKSPKKILQDGWGNNFEIIKTEDDNFILYSKEMDQIPYRR